MKAMGIDGCKNGWIVVWQEQSAVRGRVIIKIDELLTSSRDWCAAVDVPIGLSRKGRACDQQARRLGHRHSSVFTPPCREALQAPTREEAKATNHRLTGRSLSNQTLAILPKIHEVDELLHRDRSLTSVLLEVHPEVSFAAIAGGQPMAHHKKSRAGREERRAHLDRKFDTGAISHLLEDLSATVARRSGPHVDDVYDALAALWTAERVVRSEAEVLVGEPRHDSEGLPMQMMV